MSADKPIYVTQTRRGVYDSTSAVGIVYEIVTKVVENPSYSGDVRDSEHLLNLFVSNIVDASDATQDTFDHYATLADLDLLPISRSTAIASGNTQYRGNVNSIKFDNLSVAVTAAQVVRDTINNVVDTYLKVKNSFMGTDTHYFPYNIELQNLKDQYATAYTSARDARIAAEDLQKDKQLDCDTKELILEAKKKCLEDVKTFYEYVTAMNGLVNAVGTRYKKTLLDVITGYEAETANPDLEGLKTYLDTVTAEGDLVFDGTWITEILDSGSDSTGMTLLAQIIRAYSQSTQAYQRILGEVTTAELASESCASELKERQDAKAEAAKQEAAALAVLTTYCPDLDPGSL